MKTLLRVAALTALVCAISVGCASASTIYVATLSGANEVPSNGSSATGSATLTLTGDSLAVDISFSGLSAAASAGHIHCCTPPGSNVGVAVPFTAFPNVTSSGADYTNTFDLTQTATYSSSFLTANGGTAAGAEAALIAGLNAGQAYVNIHDANFPGGEIRGFDQAAVPEPGTLSMGAAALLGLAFLKRRR